jgi:malonate-semialdehyde dehydrogenase (acetylating)/methylmalonate-semialdehyde dehydrogenase
MAVPKLNYFTNGEFKESETEKYFDIYNPSTGEIIAQAPCCTLDEVNEAIDSAYNAFPEWSGMPVIKRVQVLYSFRDLLLKNLDVLTEVLCRENGKAWEEGQGDLLKVIEPVEVACGAPSLMVGESLLNTSKGFDTVLYREPMGVFAGIAPYNFPGMIPMGWMMPMCIATGNTFVLKAASMTPMTCIRLAELLKEAGLPKGVVNIVTCSRKEAELFLENEKIRGVSFVGSTSVGLHVYSRAAANGKRVQALCEAKNHALVLEDADLERTARGIINSSFGCAGQRCMALPVVVAHNRIADKLVGILTELAKNLRVGPAYEKTTQLGPVISKEHKQGVLNWIEKGISEGAKLVLDGRDIIVKGYENGFYVGPTIFDHVSGDMEIGSKEIFGPVLSVIRVNDFEEGLQVMNRSEFANGSVIYTNSGYFAREFSLRTHGGMVGVNVGIPVPVGIFPFTGHKRSFFGDLHALGKDNIRFYTESKVVTTKWFDNEEKMEKKVSTWDGTI